MNFINAFFLSLFLKPAGIYRFLGVDTVKLKSLLTCKLTIDDRQPFTFNLTGQNKSEEPVSDATWLATGIYTFMGLIFMALFFFGNNPGFQFTAFFSIYMVLLSLSLIVDFTRVLIDVRDNFIILPKPVDDRTFLIARVVHIAIHISKMAIPLSLPSAIVILILHGIGGFSSFLLATILATIFSIFLINVTYLAILRFSTPDKFKSIIAYLQIGFTILFYGGFQIMPRVLTKNIENFDLQTLPWINAIPFYWFAALWQMLTHPIWNFNLVLGALLALLMPALGIYLVVKVFAPAFNRKLSLIAGSVDSTPALATTGKIKTSWGDKVGTLITSHGPERMGYEFSWRMMLRSRDFKMMLYPSIGYMLVILVLFILQTGNFSLSDYLISDPKNHFTMLLILYSPALLVMGAASQIHLTPGWKASWIFKMSSTVKPGAIISGSLKAIIIQFMAIPIFSILVFGLLLNGIAFLPPLLMAVCMQILLLYLLSLINNTYLPCSYPLSKAGNDGISIATAILAVIIIGIVIFLQWLIFSYDWAMISVAAIAIFLIMQIHKGIFNKPWKRIEFAKETT